VAAADADAEEVADAIGQDTFELITRPVPPSGIGPLKAPTTNGLIRSQCASDPAR
jgi:hypothetical protein